MNQSISKDRKLISITVFVIVIVSAIMRLINLGELSLSNDELSSLARIRYDSFSEMITKGVYIDFHPAGLQTFYYYWVKVFGDDAYFLRLPFVVAAALSVLFIYRIGKQWYGELTGMLSAACFGFLSFFIVFTQLARMYSPGVLFCMMTVFYWNKFLFEAGEEKKNKSWLWWVISMSLAMHMHYFSFMFVGLVGLSGFFFVRRKHLVKYITGGTIALILFIPEIPVFLQQIKAGDIGGWLPPPERTFLIDFFFEMFNQSFLVIAVVVMVMMWGIFKGAGKIEFNRWRLLSLSWFLVVFLTAYLYSVLRHPILMYSTLIFVFPFILMLIFSYVPRLVRTAKSTVVFTAVFSAILIFDTVIIAKQYSTKFFGVFREVAVDVEEWMKKYNDKNIPVVVNVINPDYMKYYFKRMDEPPNVLDFGIESPEDFTKLNTYCRNSDSQYFSYIWSNSSHPLEITEIIRVSFPYLVEKNEYFNAASYLFSKKNNGSAINTRLFSSICDFDSSRWTFDEASLTTEKFYSGNYSQKLITDYSSSLKRKSSELGFKENSYVSFSSRIYFDTEIKDAQLVVSFDRDDKPYNYRSVLISDFKLEAGKWHQVFIASEVPGDIQSDDVLVAYIWNPGFKTFYIDDMKVEVHEGYDPYVRKRE